MEFEQGYVYMCIFIYDAYINKYINKYYMCIYICIYIYRI